MEDFHTSLYRRVNHEKPHAGRLWQPNLVPPREGRMGCHEAPTIVHGPSRWDRATSLGKTRQVVPEGYPGGNSQLDVENPWLQMVAFPHVYVSLEEG